MDRALSRALAVRALTAVLSDGRPLPEALSRAEGGDRAQLTELCSGVLRWKGRLDLAIDSAALKKKPSGWLRKILLIGAYQLVAQERVAPAVVVSETVSEVKKKEGEAPAKFANALLRRIAETARAWRELPLREDAPAAEQAAWASLPEWFWSRLVAQRGLEWSRRFAEASFERPRLWLRVADVAEPREAQGGAVTGMEGFAEGKFFVQDISSQFLVKEISSIVKEAIQKETGRENPSVLDLCSAPGGKSAGLAWNGFHVLATDSDAGRLAKTRENALRLRVPAEKARGSIRIIERADALGLESPDLAWVDAPCTGSGIIRRHPDVRWLRREKDLESLAGLQIALVREAWSKIRQGGFLAYSVCSVFQEEGPHVLREAGLEDGILNSWFLCPQERPYGDGFWAALVRKT